jgi:hypothetical protein
MKTADQMAQLMAVLMVQTMVFQMVRMLAYPMAQALGLTTATRMDDCSGSVMAESWELLTVLQTAL